MIHLSVVCCGRAVPLLWRVLEHGSATVAFGEYKGLLRKARWLLRYHPDVMLLADRGFANHALMQWLRSSGWHYCLRLPCDVLLHGTRRYPAAVGSLYPSVGEARFY
ncbi:transposase, partial [Vogesella mureinivorans]|uniref:transposase n=1 Tax=Vogesella mureinivorans TaxID=657276 RepID=UPI0034DE6E85